LINKPYILLVHQHFSPPNGFGNNRSLELAQYWQSLGYQVKVISGAGNFEKKLNHSLTLNGIEVEVIGVDYHHYMGFVRRMYAFIAFAFKVIIRLSRYKNADLIYTVSTPLSIGWIGLRFKSVYQKKFYFEIGDLWPDIPIQMGVLSNPILKFFALYLEKKIYENADHIICLSPGIQEHLLHYKGLSAEKVILSFNGTNTELFTPTNQKLNLRSSLNIPAHVFVVIYAGTIGKANGLEAMLRLALDCKEDGDIQFYIIGEGNDVTYIDKYIKEYALIHVHRLPSVKKSDIVSWLQASDIGFVSYAPYSLLSTNSANKWYDYLACGLPVIVNHSGWQDEWMRKYTCGLGASDIQMQKKYLYQLKNSSELYQQHSKNARQMAVDHFDRHHLASTLDSLFLGCC
jgi:glycosyltransferase involved in cell wall biosynthesis